jgi:hypothetical protein
MKYQSSRQLSAEKNTCFALIGLSGELKSELASRLAPARSEIPVSSLIWSEYLFGALRDFLQTRIDSDPLLKYWHDSGAFRFESVPERSLAMAASYMGILGKPDKGGIPLEEFLSTQAKYRRAVRDTILKIHHEEAFHKEHTVIITPSSLCDVTDLDDAENDDVLRWFTASNCFAINVVPTDEQMAKITREGYTHDRPDYYRPDFLGRQIPLVLKELGATHVSECEPDEIMGQLYERLVAERPDRNLRLVKAIGGVTLPAELLIDADRDGIMDTIGDAIDAHRRYRRIQEEEVA